MKYLFLLCLIGLLGIVACSPRTAQTEGDTATRKPTDTTVIISPSTERKVVYTEKAPKPVGPYSQAIFKNNTLYVAGQLGINPQTGLLVGDSVDVQTRQALENIKAIVEAAGLKLSDVVQTTVYLKNINDFDKMNKVYAAYFRGISPARATIEVAAIPLKAKVEIVAIAVK